MEGNGMREAIEAIIAGNERRLKGVEELKSAKNSIAYAKYLDGLGDATKIMLQDLKEVLSQHDPNNSSERISADTERTQ
jgi:hypothetical protein